MRTRTSISSLLSLLAIAWPFLLMTPAHGDAGYNPFRLLATPKSCTGCCSSHGGVSSSCSGGNIVCNDGTRSPSCSCGSCSGSVTPPPSVCSYTYSPWSTCQPSGTQSRSVISSSPFGCIGSPVLTQLCTYTAPATCTYTYSAWSACQPNGTQSRTVVSVAPGGCSGSPGPLAQACTYAALADTTNYTALWWDPQESGWGLNVNQQDQTIFATLFTYGSTGGPSWLVASGMTRQSDGSFQGPLYRLTGPAFNQTPWTAVEVAQVGAMQLVFTAPDKGTVSYTSGLAMVSKPIEKQAFRTVAVCKGTTGSRAAATNYQDLWWNPHESGWGVNLTQQGDVIFSTLFTYDASGKDLWLVASSMAKQADGSFSGALYSMKGPPPGTAWSGVVPTSVGSMSVKFASGEAGTLTYTYNGVTVMKSIQRQVFGTVVPLCQ